ncbi:MAG: RNA methyltransferase [Bacteroidales bacterium]|nr:RNA methyltransferase [Bacteroidales bacterium]
MPEIKEKYKSLFAKYSLEQKKQLYEAMTDFFSENKRQLLDQNIQNRTKHLTLVMEDIFQSQNASAVLRTCDCFGIQNVHIIENQYEYTLNPDVALGSSKWVNYYRYSKKNENNTLLAYEALRKKGYKIIATLPHENDVMLSDLDVTQPIALVFGTEKTGLSQDAIDNADGFVKIPMYGFTESFNISVSAALCSFYLTEKMRNTPGLDWRLPEDEQVEQKLYWARQIVRESDKIYKKLAEDLGLPTYEF